MHWIIDLEMKRFMRSPVFSFKMVFVLIYFLLLSGCAFFSKTDTLPPATYENSALPYIVAPGDELDVFVWGDPRLSTTVKVRPDGKITTPLVEDLQASGKTPHQLARQIEKQLAQYVLDPVVTVKVNKFVGRYSEQIRIVGQAVRPQSLPYRENITALDVMIAVGGLTDFADGNRATLIRNISGKEKKYNVRLDDLVNEGDISANVDMLPGDILIIPEAWF